MPPKITGYQSTPEKDAVRDHFDLPLLQAFSSDKGGKLAYFGLPGEECRDIHAWRDLLSEVAAVERKPSNLRKMREVLTQRFRALSPSVYHGDVDDIILSGEGKYRGPRAKRPKTEVANDFDWHLDRRVWKFDVVYLDYFGPLLPRGGGNFPHARRKRPKALRHLFRPERLDARESWLLLLTVAGGEETAEDAQKLIRCIERARRGNDFDLSEAVDFLLSSDCGADDPMVKLIHGSIGLFVSAIATPAGLVPHPRGTVSYLGYNNRMMVHCAFQMERADQLPATSGNPLPLLRAPIIKPVVEDQVTYFDWASDICPGTTRESVLDCLGFLGHGGVGPLMGSLP